MKIDSSVDPKVLFVQRIIDERKEELSKQEYRILIIRHKGLGDVLMCIPIIERMRKDYPNAVIDMMTDKNLFFFFKHLVDNLYDYETERPQGIYSHIYNLVMGVELHPETYKKHRQLCFFELCGYNNCGFETVNKLRLPEILSAHEVIDIQGKWTDLFMAPWILLNIDTSRKSKDWPARKWFALAKRLAKLYAYNIILTGGKRVEKEFNEKNIFNLTGETTLQELTYLVAGANFIVTGETGVMHLAGFLEKNQMVLVGPSNLELFAKCYRYISYISIPLPCSECCSQCAYGICMHMSVSQVYDAVYRHLRKRDAVVYIASLRWRRAKLILRNSLDWLYRKLRVYSRRAKAWRKMNQTSLEGTGLSVSRGDSVKK